MSSELNCGIVSPSAGIPTVDVVRLSHALHFLQLQLDAADPAGDEVVDCGCNKAEDEADPAVEDGEDDERYQGHEECDEAAGALGHGVSRYQTDEGADQPDKGDERADKQAQGSVEQAQDLGPREGTNAPYAYHGA